MMKGTRNTKHDLHGEKGSAMVIALMVMTLLLGFVALAISRTTTETIAASNDAAETRAFEAAHASLEVMTRNFNKNFETSLNITSADITRIQGQHPPGFSEYVFNQTITQTESTKDVVLTGEMFQGLYALRDEWQLNTSATRSQDGVQVLLRRRFFNDRIPIFQFGIFYDDDLEFHPGPRFDFGGRVHSNGHLFLQANDGLYFASKVSSAKSVFTDVSKNGTSWTNWDDEVYIKNASGNYVQLKSTMGSVLNSVVNGSPVITAPWPTAYASAAWNSNRNLFQGNLIANSKPLELPIKLNSDISETNVDLVELVKRGKQVGDLWNAASPSGTPNVIPVVAGTSDDRITAADRFYNKTGIRVSLADSKAKLPGCVQASGAAVTGWCGVRLDGDTSGSNSSAAANGTRTGGTTTSGYQPRAMTGSPSYQATTLNGDRFYMSGKETWIKIETVVFNAATQNYDTQDITQDFLALGITEAAPNVSSEFSIIDSNYNANAYDSRSIIKLQRFMIPGTAIPNTTGATSTTGYISTGNFGSRDYNYVMPATVSSTTSSNRCNDTGDAATTVNGGTHGSFPAVDRAHWKTATVEGLSNKYGCVIPVPIKMFDTREGLYNDTDTVFDPTASGNYGQNVPWAGVMSIIDIDVANLRAFLSGTYDARMPSGTPYATATGHVLRSTDIPQNQGWVFYVSDRRGDWDFDGEYDMEDIFGNNDNQMQPGEDVNKTGNLQRDFTNEAVRYTGTGNHISPDIAAVFEHKYYRRGVRLINGSTLPGIYDATTPANTRGFTVASENGVYVFGNYNATGIASVGTPTPSTDYLPQNTSLHIPASICADAVTILSNNWKDALSFREPFNLGGRTTSETTTRFAMISGDTITSLNGTPNQGGGDPRLNGGVHNFLRFLERWDDRLNYSGSLINLYNAHNNNGAFKCCNNVYSPPTRNWVFDATFLDANRLPPGTPYFQSIQITGFQRVN